MKALTVQQPWAWAIIHGGKTVENRTQQWTYRGTLAIHAGARWSYSGSISGLVWNAWNPAAVPSRPLDPKAFDFGLILGVVDLVDCHPDAGCCRPWGESAYVEHGGRQRRHIIHLVLENPRPLAEPIPCKGALSLWTPPADIAERLRAVAHG